MKDIKGWYNVNLTSELTVMREVWERVEYLPIPLISSQPFPALSLWPRSPSAPAQDGCKVYEDTVGIGIRVVDFLSSQKTIGLQLRHPDDLLTARNHHIGSFVVLIDHNSNPV